MVLGEPLGARQGHEPLQGMLSDWPMERPRDWMRLVNQPMREQEADRIRTYIARNRPYGNEEWQHQRAEELGLLDTLRREGRPSTKAKETN